MNEEQYIRHLLESLKKAGYSREETTALLEKLANQEVTIRLLGSDDGQQFWLIEPNPPVTMEDIAQAAAANPNGKDLLMNMNWTLEGWLFQYRCLLPNH